MNNGAEDYRALPRIALEELELVHDTEYYDGPIAGLFRRGQDLFYFRWDHEAAEDDGRVYVLSQLPAELQARTLAWHARHAALRSEYRLVANPHAYPVSDWQRNRLRPLEAIERDLKSHDESCPSWEELPISAWCQGFAPELAAIQTFTLSAETSRLFQRWQRDVARALADEDQAALDTLFAAPPVACEPHEIYRVQLAVAGGVREVLRDHRGQPLPADFEMSAEHSVQWLNGLLPDEPTGA